MHRRRVPDWFLATIVIVAVVVRGVTAYTADLGGISAISEIGSL